MMAIHYVLEVSQCETKKHNSVLKAPTIDIPKVSRTADAYWRPLPAEVEARTAANVFERSTSVRVH
jgi:hypothetical protein